MMIKSSCILSYSGLHLGLDTARTLLDGKVYKFYDTIDLDHPYAKAYLSCLGALKEPYGIASDEMYRTIRLSFDIIPSLHKDIEIMLRKRERKLLDYDGARRRKVLKKLGEEEEEEVEPSSLSSSSESSMLKTAKTIYEEIHGKVMEELRNFSELRSRICCSSLHVLLAAHHKLFNELSRNLKGLEEKYSIAFQSMFPESTDVKELNFQLKRQRILQQMTSLSLVSADRIT
jgi:hypothetical protein